MQAYSDDQTNTEQFAIRNAIKTALGSDVSVDACTILTYLTPSSEKDGFSSQLRLADVCAEKREMVQRCMNAAATVGCITCVGEPGKYERILVKNTFCRALLAMADTAATIKAASTEANPEPIVQNTASPRRDYKSRGGIKPARQSKSTNPELPKSVLTRSAERRRNAPKHQVSTVALGMEKKDSAPCGEPHKPSTTSVKETKKPPKVSITGDTITFE